MPTYAGCAQTHLAVPSIDLLRALGLDSESASTSIADAPIAADACCTDSGSGRGSLAAKPQCATSKCCHNAQELGNESQFAASRLGVEINCRNGAKK